ncbi:MAG: ATP-binding protein [Gemmataceae bacterium]
MSAHILAIEDDDDTLANLRDILGLDGHKLTGAGTLRKAMALRPWTEFAVILLDRRLPDGSADAILPQIQAAAPHAAVIVLTGYADVDGTIAALRSGVTDFLLKPINPDLLRAAIARAVKVREMEERALQAERLAGIGQMVTVLSHESGNALARCQACLELLAEEVHDRPEALDLVHRLQRAQDDLGRLYRDLRAYAAPIRLERDTWDLRTVWRQSWENVLSARGAPESATLAERTPGMELDCEVDAFQLGQVFRNLFENALAASPRPALVEVSCRAAVLSGGSALRLAVRDNGPGLTAEQQQNVFAPFYTTKRKGTGLGLAIVRRILEAHGGTIVVGVDGPGAEFVLTLPRSASFGEINQSSAIRPFTRDEVAIVK